jgi:hypothetical protein
MHVESQMVAVKAGQRIELKTQVDAQQEAKERLVYGWLVYQKAYYCRSEVVT